MQENLSRRRFLKISTLSLASLPFLAGALSALPKSARADGLPPVKENEGTAKALNYCIDADKAAKAKKQSCPARKGKEHAGEYCRNCQLYTKAQGDGKTEMGTCLVIPTNLVYGSGWCNSYTKKFS